MAKYTSSQDFQSGEPFHVAVHSREDEADTSSPRQGAAAANRSSSPSSSFWERSGLVWAIGYLGGLYDLPAGMDQFDRQRLRQLCEGLAAILGKAVASKLNIAPTRENCRLLAAVFVRIALRDPDLVRIAAQKKRPPTTSAETARKRARSKVNRELKTETLGLWRPRQGPYAYKPLIDSYPHSREIPESCVGGTEYDHEDDREDHGPPRKVRKLWQRDRMELEELIEEDPSGRVQSEPASPPKIRKPGRPLTQTPGVGGADWIVVAVGLRRRGVDVDRPLSARERDHFEGFSSGASDEELAELWFGSRSAKDTANVRQRRSRLRTKFCETLSPLISEGGPMSTTEAPTVVERVTRLEQQYAQLSEDVRRTAEQVGIETDDERVRIAVDQFLASLDR